MPRVEQAVYGSFPFRPGGYELLCASPGCRPEWLSAFRAACERYGERPREADAAGLFAVRLEGGGPRAVVGVSDSGPDDRGRPGALAFHGIFIAERDYRRLGAWPFRLAEHHRRDWGPDDAARALPTLTVEPRRPAPPPDPSPEAARIAAAIAAGRRVAVESDSPIEMLAREVWAALPDRARRRATLATRAFSAGLEVDLLGLPPRGRALLDPADGYLDPAGLIEPVPASPRPRRRRPVALLAGAVALSLAAALYAASGRPGAVVPAPSEPVPPPVTPATPRLAEPPLPPDPDTAARVAAGLIDLAERFGAAEPGEFPPGSDPSALMARIADRLRYRGPLLSESERARLRDERSPGRARALAWDAHVRRFAGDRPLPPGFDRAPLRAQLDALARHFGVEPDPALAVEEIPPALAHALAVDGPIAPNPLAPRYPALDAYARFLDGLPRR